MIWIMQRLFSKSWKRESDLKVSSCILLFGYKRLDTFPIDTWVKKSISDLYNIKNDQKTIEKFAEQTYKEYSGLAIQYLFHSKRNIN